MEGIFHAYRRNPTLTLFEYTVRTRQSPTPNVTSANILLFIGGLYDNFQSPEYLVDLANLFPRHEFQKWTVIHAQLSSAMRAFGISDLHKDIEEIASAITYIREVIRKGLPTNVVLLGHSTGCQDVLHYLYAPVAAGTVRPVVQGAILQAPVSDRDAVMMCRVDVDPLMKDLYEKCLALIATIPESRHKSYMLPLDWTEPLFGSAPLCVSRFLDLASPSSPENPRIDDLFSNDLPESRLNATLGEVGSNKILTRLSQASGDLSILMLVSQRDTIIMKPKDANEMLRLWGNALSSNADHSVMLHSQSKVIKGATHDISGNSPEEQRAKLVVFRESLLRYLEDVVGGVDESAWVEWKNGLQAVETLEKQG